MRRRSWWQRSLDRHFRPLEGKTDRKCDLEDLQKEIASRIEEIRKETKEYREKFRHDVERYAARLVHARHEWKEVNRYGVRVRG